MRIRFATLNLQVADPQRSKRFYIDGMGMRENEERSHAPCFVYLDSDGVAVTLASREDGAEPAPPSPSIEIGFEVDDLDALQARFAERGIAGFVPQSMGWAEVLEGQDADGHRVIVYQFSRSLKSSPTPECSAPPQSDGTFAPQLDPCFPYLRLFEGFLGTLPIPRRSSRLCPPGRPTLDIT